MRSYRVTPNTVATPNEWNALHEDARGASRLLAHQMYGTIALPTNPANGKTLTLDINGTNVTITFVSVIGSTAGNVLIGASAAATAVNLLQLLQNPTISNSTQVAIGANTAANVTLLNYIAWSLIASGTSVVASSNAFSLYTPDTSFSASTNVTGGSYTANTMALYVEPGVVYINGTEVYFNGGVAPTVTAPSSHPRIDVLTIDNTGALAWTTGTEASSPSTPTYPANKLPICELYNVTGETALYDQSNQQSGQGYIQNDVRPFLAYPIPLGAVPDSIIPAATNTYSLGNSGSQWSSLYAQTIYQNGVEIAISHFGGTGADGALSITSGTTTLSVSSALYFVKNYSSISITGTGNLTLSGTASNGTILILKSQGAVTLTSSATNLIDLTGLGASAGTSAASSFGYFTTAASGGGNGTGGTSTQGPAAPGVSGLADIATTINAGKNVPLICGGGGGIGGTPSFSFGGTQYGGGGGGGGGTAVILATSISTNTGTFSITGGAGCAYGTSSSVASGGAGGGALYIECGGALTFTGNISVAGVHGGNGTGGGTPGNGSGGNGSGGAGDIETNTAGSGGGGGSGGPGGANGGTGGGGGGGASGTSYIGLNTVFA